MPDPGTIVELPQVEPTRLTAALLAVAHEDGGAAGRLRAGAEQTLADEPADGAQARHFQTVLELGYLVASADGFADEERRTLARLLEQITSSAVDHDALELHFHDLDEAVAMLGRRERLARVAADLEDAPAVEQAISTATLIALADGRLGAAELDVLIELGEHVTFSPDRVRAVVERVAARVEAELR